MADEERINGIQILEHLQLAPRKRVANQTNPALRILQLTDMHLFPPTQTHWTLGANKNNRVVDFARDGYDTGNKKAIQLVTQLVNSVDPDIARLHKK